MNSAVSVIVTCYNHEAYIAECLQSIFQQTYQAIQLIVIDDGSEDNSPELIQELLMNAPFSATTFIQQENAGVCVARNKGLDHAVGDYVLFIDSDDFLELDYIEKLLLVARKENAEIVYGNLWDFKKEEYHVKSRPFDLVAFLQANYINNSSLVKRSIIGDTRFDLAYNRKFLEDYDFLMTLILDKKAKAVYAPEANLNYRILPQSISRKDDHTSRQGFNEVYFSILEKHAKNHPEPIFQAIENNTLLVEERLADLETHLDQVAEYVKQLKNENERLFQEKEALFHSKSYRLGNHIINPLKQGARLLKNPRLVKSAAKKVGKKIRRIWYRKPSIKGAVLRPYRQWQRRENNYQNPKRQLIYVIFEAQPRLQTYKLLFLEGLATYCDDVLIVVNGSLAKADIQSLEKFGEVLQRENEGYDTAAFRSGILYLGKEKLARKDELLLVNDTNVGPIGDLGQTLQTMALRRLDFWGISYGEEQEDFTGYNKYHYIPLHLQSYFLVLEKSLFSSPHFWDYWQNLGDTNSREKAIGKHETVFTRHFSDLGYRSGALLAHNADSAMYIHPLTMLKKGVPLIKFSAFANESNDSFLWQGLKRQTEVPALIEYLSQKTNYPMTVIHEIQHEIRRQLKPQQILIVDGVENQIPQCTRYRVLNKAEQLRSLGYQVKVVNHSQLRLADAQKAFLIVIYRCGDSPLLQELVRVAKHFKRTVLYDIDDLVIDTKYTDQLAYTQQLDSLEKANYDAGVHSYGRMLSLCDGVITTTKALAEELSAYKTPVLLNRNLASEELVVISEQALVSKDTEEKVKIGYFSGSITHNENFELIKPALKNLLERYPHVELHLVGYLDLPEDLAPFKEQIVTHDYVNWDELPELIREVDINLAPLTQTIFNEAKSEIKWLEAALVKIPTVASKLGSFAEMIQDGVTGVLATEKSWEQAMESLILDQEKRQLLAENAWNYVIEHCRTNHHEDAFTDYVAQIQAEQETEQDV